MSQTFYRIYGGARPEGPTVQIRHQSTDRRDIVLPFSLVSIFKKDTQLQELSVDLFTFAVEMLVMRSSHSSASTASFCRLP